MGDYHPAAITKHKAPGYAQVCSIISGFQQASVMLQLISLVVHVSSMHTCSWVGMAFIVMHCDLRLFIDVS